MIEFGNIVLVPFPYTDRTLAKRRPALIVSSGRYSRTDFIVCYITSQNKPYAGRIAVAPATENGLKVPSWICFDKIETLHKSLILGKLGQLDHTILHTNSALFFAAFGFKGAQIVAPNPVAKAN